MYSVSNIRNNESMLRPVCIVMMKTPRAGEVKTRLAMPMVSVNMVATLAACFAQDVVTNARRAVRETIIAYTPSNGRAELEALLSTDLQYLEQLHGADLGSRLEHVVVHADALGFSPIIIIGTDSPTLPASFTEEAVQVLSTNETDIALGGTDDGGYYLIGLRKSVSEVFQNIEWSTPRVHQQTVANAMRFGLRVHELPRWYDVDTPSDLARLRYELLTSEAARERAPSTHRWLLAHDAVFHSINGSI